MTNDERAPHRMSYTSPGDPKKGRYYDMRIDYDREKFQKHNAFLVNILIIIKLSSTGRSRQKRNLKISELTN